MNAETLVEAGTKLLLRILFLVLGLWFLYLVRNVVVLIFASVLTSAGVVPLVLRLRRYGLSKTWSVVLVYLGLFTLLVLFLWLLVPLFLSDIENFREKIPMYSLRLAESLKGIESYLQGFGIPFNHTTFLESAQSGISQSPEGVFLTTLSIFQGLIYGFGFFFLSLYLSLEENGIEKLFRTLTPKAYQATALSIAERIQSRVSQWFFGQLVLMSIIFFIYYIGYTAFGLPYALALALLGGLLEIIPYVGPVLAAIPAIIFGFLVSPILGISILLFCFLVHQVESNFIAPQIMKHSIGLSPAVLIIAALVGATLSGPIGVLLSIPVAMILSVFVEDFLEKKSNEE